MIKKKQFYYRLFLLSTQIKLIGNCQSWMRDMKGWNGFDIQVHEVKIVFYTFHNIRLSAESELAVKEIITKRDYRHFEIIFYEIFLSRIKFIISIVNSLNTLIIAFNVLV